MVQERVITFLCPNGHKLSGAASLQGKPGQCPHCHSQFMIPDYSEVSLQPDTVADAEPSDHFADTEVDLEPSQDLSSPTDLEKLSVEDTAIASVPAVSLAPRSTEPNSSRGPAADKAMSLQQAFELLWARRSAGVYVELQLKSGDLLRPEFYSASLSGPLQGLFATRDEDGSYALAAIAWDAVAQVCLRGVLQIPEDLFAS
ncbi:MAG: hypothetical protein GTO53_00935 [Planctomycetales bacterium]|nr:hypothetical protein [Planctomycetales bacterium]NIM07742.1 hypothetical protein [Planctomycetales bacterium]NIN07241.1 hypothetical protein [Planctomycetales bacterium]NIN76334.1 hypothetical protein [Planctomycetales bacterium]NIO33544.1 hypothetical protein [Planctomycetales bacterium]